MALPAALLAAAALSGCASSGGARSRAAAADPWSAPATLSSCGGHAPHVVFPSDSPTHATGQGAIVWAPSAGCPGGDGARVAALGGDDLPGSPYAVTLLGSPPGTAGGASGAGPAAGAAPHGMVAIVGDTGGAAHGQGGGRAVAVQGPARGPFSVIAPGTSLGAPYALTTGYLGDLALAARAGGESGPVQLQVERFFTRGFVRSGLAGGSAGSLAALTVALDYRSDALVGWVQNGSIYARALPTKFPPHSIQRLAAAGSQVSLSAVISDNYRATVAWSERQGDETSVFLDRSRRGVSFGTPTLLERFRDVRGTPPPAASPRLVRLSNESVILIWAGVSAGRWVVHALPLNEDGVGSGATLSSPGADALLAGVAAGPRSDLLVTWTERRLTGASGPGEALFAARGFRVHPDRMWFGPSEEVSAAAGGEVAAAFDPDTDRALAVWRTPSGSLQFAVRGAGGHPDITGG